MMTRSCTYWRAVAVAGALLACDAPSEPALRAVAQSVIGGEPATACQWPSTVRVDGASSCTGTLIHPRVVTTAAHCLDGSSATITFGMSRDAPGAFSLTGECHAGARGENGVNSRD